MANGLKQVVATFIVDRNTIKYRIEIERILDPPTGKFTATAYLLDASGDGQERWAVYDLMKVEADDAKTAFAMANDALAGTNARVSRW